MEALHSGSSLAQVRSVHPSHCLLSLDSSLGPGPLQSPAFLTTRLAPHRLRGPGAPGQPDAGSSGLWGEMAAVHLPLITKPCMVHVPAFSARTFVVVLKPHTWCFLLGLHHSPDGLPVCTGA